MTTAAAYRMALLEQMSETTFQSEVIGMASDLDWYAFHHPDSRKDTKAGLPDLTLLHLRTGRIIFAELKTMTGRLRPSQRRFLEAALLDSSNELALWRPSDLEEIALILAGKRCGPLVLPPPPRTRAKPTGREQLEHIIRDAQHHRRRTRR